LKHIIAVISKKNSILLTINLNNVKHLNYFTMLRRFLYLAVLAAALTSCGNKTSKNESSQNGESAVAMKVAFDSLIANPDNYIGKTISLEGKVIHVCTETGKKMFISGSNPDVSLYIAAGDKISKFPMELLGSEITVEGTITRAPGAESSEPEMKEMHSGKNMEMSGDSCETEKAMSAQVSLSDIRMQYLRHSVK
jgi:hypothetical protein